MSSKAVNQAAGIWGFSGCPLYQEDLREFRDFFGAVPGYEYKMNISLWVEQELGQ